MSIVSMRQMLEAGVHFGHQTHRWNPRMKRFIFGERNGIYIIDLEQTLDRVETSYKFVRDMVAKAGSILFIGTKKQAQDPIKFFAEKCGMPYINERWLAACSPTSTPSQSVLAKCRTTSACVTLASLN